MAGAQSRNGADGIRELTEQMVSYAESGSAVSNSVRRLGMHTGELRPALGRATQEQQSPRCPCRITGSLQRGDLNQGTRVAPAVNLQ